MTRRSAFLLALALTLAGCAEPKLDASDEASLSRSLERLKGSLDDPGRMQLQSDVMTLMEIPSDATPLSRPADAPAAGRPPTLVEVLKPLHGMTAPEIHARAEALRASAAARKNSPAR